MIGSPCCACSVRIFKVLAIIYDIFTKSFSIGVLRRSANQWTGLFNEEEGRHSV